MNDRPLWKMDGYLSVLFLLSSFVIGITADNRRYIDFRPGYEYVYSFNGYTNVRELGKFLVEAKVNIWFYFSQVTKIFLSFPSRSLLWILQILYIERYDIVKNYCNFRFNRNLHTYPQQHFKIFTFANVLIWTYR